MIQEVLHIHKTSVLLFNTSVYKERRVKNHLQFIISRAIS